MAPTAPSRARRRQRWRLRAASGRAPTPPMPLFKLRFPPAPLAAAKSTADLLAELTSPCALAVTLFENGPRSFVVEAYYGAPSCLEDLTRPPWSQATALPAPVLEAVPEQDW